MELKAIRSYKVPKYPTIIEADANSELLREPLEKWKKVGITSALLIALLSCNSISNAMNPGSIGNNPMLTGGAPLSYYKYHMATPYTKDNIKKAIFLENFRGRGEVSYFDSEECTTTSKTEFNGFVQSLLDWLFIQGLM